MRLAPPLTLATGPLLLALATPAMAQEGPPPLRPGQDVAITYRYTGVVPPGLPEVRTRTLIAAATGRQRQENAGLVAILDPAARRRFSFVTDPRDPASGVVTEHDASDELALDELAADPDFRLTRLGEARFAGLGCTLWRILLREMPEEEAQTVCVAQDGLPLMTEARQQGMTSRMEAIRVEYGPLDAALFAWPAGWPVRRLEPAPR